MLGSFLPSLLVVMQPESARVEGADAVMKLTASCSINDLRGEIGAISHACYDKVDVFPRLTRLTPAARSYNFNSCGASKTAPEDSQELH